jgi:hypothetical protein
MAAADWFDRLLALNAELFAAEHYEAGYDALMTRAVAAAGVDHPVGAGTTYPYILKDLATLPGRANSYGQAVHASGRVAGGADTASGLSHAFLFGPRGGDQ